MAQRQTAYWMLHRREVRMKKKAVIIIIACVVVLAGIVLAYFTLPISYAGTSEKHYIGVLDEHIKERGQA